MNIHLSNENEYSIKLSTFLSIEETSTIYLLFADKTTAYIIDKSQIPEMYQESLSKLLHKVKAKLTISDHLV